MKAIIQIHRKRGTPPKNENQSIEAISLIIPFRNESQNIEKLLTNLVKIDTHGIKMQIILIDDNSEDDWKPIFESFKSEHPNFHLDLLQIFDGIPSKKKALIKGIELAKYNWILQTDADCEISDKWIKSYLSQIDENVGFVAGPVSFKPNGFLSKLLSIESWALIGVSYYGFILNKPQMASAANMIWNKSYLKIKDLNQIFKSELRSGDDVFLMNYFRKEFPDKLQYNWDRNALVMTEGSENLRDFFNQRIRWASKWKHNDLNDQKYFPLLILSYHLLNIVLPVILFVHGSYFFLVLIILLKAFAEFIFLSFISNHFGKRVPIFGFVFLQFIYSSYVVIFGVLSQLLTFKWK